MRNLPRLRGPNLEDQVDRQLEQIDLSRGPPANRARGVVDHQHLGARRRFSFWYVFSRI